MAYEIGSWLNPSDGLDKIRVFLIAQGWTVDSFVVEAPGKRLHMHKGTTYLNAHSSDDSTIRLWDTTYSGAGMPQIGFNLGTGYSGATSWRDQPGVVRDPVGTPIGSAMQLPAAAIVSYRFDYDDLYKSLVVYVQTTIGVWRWMGFGESLIKAGVWTGGAWIASSSNFYYANYVAYPGNNSPDSAYPFGANENFAAMAYLRADVDAYVGKWVSCSPTDGTGKGGGTNVAGSRPVQATIPSLAALHNRARNSLNSLSVLLPLQLFANRDAGGVSLLGTLPNIYATNTAGMVPGQPYQQGVDWFTPYPGDVPTRGTVIKRV